MIPPLADGSKRRAIELKCWLLSFFTDGVLAIPPRCKKGVFMANKINDNQHSLESNNVRLKKENPLGKVIIWIARIESCIRFFERCKLWLIEKFPNLFDV